MTLDLPAIVGALILGLAGNAIWSLALSRPINEWLDRRSTRRFAARTAQAVEARGRARFYIDNPHAFTHYVLRVIAATVVMSMVILSTAVAFVSILVLDLDGPALPEIARFVIAVVVGGTNVATIGLLFRAWLRVEEEFRQIRLLRMEQP